MLDLYKEKHYEIFDPHDARQVALFFDKADAKAYLEWRNKKVAEPQEAEPEDLISGVGLVVSELGELGLVIPTDDAGEHLIVQMSDVEGRNLAAQIDAVLA